MLHGTGTCAYVHACGRACVCVCVCVCVCAPNTKWWILYNIYTLAGNLIVRRCAAESITMIKGHFGHVGLYELHTKLNIYGHDQFTQYRQSSNGPLRHHKHTVYVTYVQCTGVKYAKLQSYTVTPQINTWYILCMS